MKKIKFLQGTAVLILGFGIMFAFSGCTASGIDERTIIDGIVISANNKNITYDFSVLRAELEEGDSALYSIKADTLNQAIEELEVQTSRKPFFGQTQYILVNNRLSKKQTLEQLNNFTKDNGVSPNTSFYFVTDKGVKYLYEKKMTGKFFLTLAKIENKKNVNTTLLTAVNEMYEENKTAVLSVLNEKDGQLVLEKIEK